MVLEVGFNFALCMNSVSHTSSFDNMRLRSINDVVFCFFFLKKIKVT